MSQGTEPVVTSARDLTDALNRLTGRLEEVRADSENRDKQLAERDAQLSRYGQKNRHLIWVTIVSLVLDLLLTAALTVVAVQANRASGAASAVAQSDRNLCLSGNVSRAQQVSLWNYVLTTVPQQPASPAERTRIAEFKAHLHKLFAPRNCDHVNPQSP
jgi:hypothetical protein